MSDHGFCDFTKQVELNRWLQRERFLSVRPQAMLTTSTLADVDWQRTKAYNLGLNAIYVNQRGREKWGIVEPADVPALCDELIARLKAMRDPQTGDAVISEVWKTSDLYPGPEQSMLPDLIVGFRPPYRLSWASALGNSPPGGIVSLNTDKWSGDHCVDPQFVPGVLASNLPISTDGAGLADIAPTILGLLGLPAGEAMTGRDLSGSRKP
jgi:predicted AlkP superfamily phosphohydrolase/phosphomutase